MYVRTEAHRSNDSGHPPTHRALARRALRSPSAHGPAQGATRASRTILCLLAAGWIGLSGCAHVAPYEREHLADRTMDTAAAERLESSFNAHVHDSREGSTGGASSTGGGCGCN